MSDPISWRNVKIAFSGREERAEEHARQSRVNPWDARKALEDTLERLRDLKNNK
jgi:hypothetical protein